MEWQGDEEYEEEVDNLSLDAIGGKAKGKGQKDKSKGTGKGKEKGKERTAWVERRACHGCGVLCHILRDCPAA